MNTTKAYELLFGNIRDMIVELYDPISGIKPRAMITDVRIAGYFDHDEEFLPKEELSITLLLPDVTDLVNYHDADAWANKIISLQLKLYVDYHEVLSMNEIKYIVPNFYKNDTLLIKIDPAHMITPTQTDDTSRIITL